MKRLARIAAVAIPLITLAGGPIFAAVKTKEQSTLRFEGFLGFLFNRTKAAKEGVVNTAAVKGTRKATMNETTVPTNVGASPTPSPSASFNS